LPKLLKNKGIEFMRIKSQNRYPIKTLNRIFKLLRFSAGLTQEEIGQKIGVSWQEIEYGKTSVTYDSLLVIAEWVDIPVWALIYVAEYFDRPEADLFLEVSDLPPVVAGLIKLLHLPEHFAEDDSLE
jgi:transcriptional regulator with XRE-family HTH domain